MYHRFAIIILIFLAITQRSFAQQASVVVQNAPTNDQEAQSIEIKWYAQQIRFSEGVHIYRRQKGTSDWRKLTDSPILPKQSVDPKFIEEDPDLEFFTELVKEQGMDISEQLLLFNLVIKTFESTPFADFMGLYYRDYDVADGVQYEYRVQKIVNGRESFLGQSDPIVVGRYVPDRAVKDFSVTQNKQIMEFDWQPEDERFYAVNLYQTVLDSIGERKVNKKPIVITQIQSDSGLVYPTPKYKLSDLQEGRTYGFEIAGLDFFGNELKRTEKKIIAFKDVTPPKPPTYLSAKQDTLVIFLEWRNPDDPQVDEMVLFRSSVSEGPFEPILRTKDQNSFTDKLEKAGPYYYYVSSFDFAGNESASRTVLVNMPDQQAPAKPEGITIASDTGRFHLAWRANIEDDIMGYLIFRNASRAEKFNVLLNADPHPDTTFTYILPENVQNEFSFYLVAVDSTGNRSEPSSLAVAKLPDITSPETPVLTRASYDQEFINLHWVANVDNDLQGYHLLRSDSSGGAAFRKVNQRIIPADITEFKDRSAIPGQKYLYRLVALDLNGNSSEQSSPIPAMIKVAQNQTQDQLRLSVKYKRRQKKNLLAWSTSQDGLIGYMIYKGVSEDRLKPCTGVMQTQTYQDKLSDEKQVFYQVRAFTKSGDILKSDLQVWKK